MILAGIDEAGYGPLLGPLIVGCCAIEFDADPAADLPCLWKRLKKIVSKSRSRDGKRLHINDSKVVYSPAQGIRELERSILALAAADGAWHATLDSFLGQVSPDALSDLAAHAWYAAAADEGFPLDQDAMAVRIMANALRAEMTRSGTALAYLSARVLPERQLNRMFNATRNKSNTLFSIAAIHLDHLLRSFGSRGLVIFCDRQGGREHYGALLRLMFDEWSLQVLAESEGRSEYRLLRGPDVVRLIFCEKAEAQCLPVAAASMLSKYLREALMRRFNTFWRQHLPQVAPTAGYYNDGSRFLAEIDAKRRELGIADAELIRSR